ncbi:MAG: hypothetical protein ACT4ON_03070 [Bacteroidota bacterium]
MNAVLYNDKKTAFFIAVGGTFPEFIYCALAVYANSFLQSSDIVQLVLKIVFIIVLITTGFVFWFKKNIPVNFDISLNPTANTIKYVRKGFLLAAFNPQLLPFWVFTQVYFNSIKFLQIKSGIHQISFILGSGLGAFMLLTILIFIINRYKTEILNYYNNNYYSKTLSMLFLAIAIHQMVLLIKQIF